MDWMSEGIEIVPLALTMTLVPFTSSASGPPLLADMAAVETDVHWLKAVATKLFAEALSKIGLKSP